MQKTVNCRRLDSNMLKLIAIVAMTADHIAWLLFPGYPAEPLPIILHIIGRLTCPVMCFFIAEGYHYTHDVKKYTARLFVLAVISHFAYVLASNDFVDWHSFIPFYYGSVLNQTGVIWSLAWGLVMLRVAKDERYARKGNPDLAHLRRGTSRRLELHSVAQYNVDRHEQGRAEKADSVVRALGRGLCRCLFLCDR